MAKSETTKFFSNKQEKLIANELGGYPVGLSGAGPANPGDVRTYDWLVECKTHTSPDHNIIFNLDVWKKIEDEAMAMHRKPVLIVDDGSQSLKKTWCLCRANNIDLSGTISADLPLQVKKNITCKQDKLASHLVDSTKEFMCDLYEYAVYEVEWNNETVIVMPFETFKEKFEK